MAYGDAESRRRLGEDIGEKAKESEFATGRDVGRIGDPELVGRCRLELSIREIEGGSPRSFCTSLSTIGVVQSVPLCQTAHVTTGVGVRLQIDLMAPADIPAVVGLQTAFLNGSVVTELGSAFLTRFHAVALQHKASRAFVARDTSRRIVGFALGSVDVNG